MLQMMRGPFTPFDQLQRSRRRLDALIYGEIDRRRATGERGEDILSMLLDAADEEGETLSRRHVRDEVMTLLFAGTTRPPRRSRSCSTSWPGNPQLLDDPAISVDMIVDETLRKYPPAYIGPRRSVEAFEFKGATVPAGAHVHYCSWASHHLPDVFAEPEAFRPQRFSEENRAKLPRGAYVPFGGWLAHLHRDALRARRGERDRRADPRSLPPRTWPGFELEIRHAPTISPRRGLPAPSVQRRLAGALAAYA